MTYSNKKVSLLLKVSLSVIYHFPSQNNSAFDLFLPNFEKLLSNLSKRKPSLSVIMHSFIARSSPWWPRGVNTTVGSKLFSLFSSNGFRQVTHIQTSSSSCIDLIFTDQPNLSVNSSVHASLHRNCHHQSVHSSFNLNI